MLPVHIGLIARLKVTRPSLQELWVFTVEAAGKLLSPKPELRVPSSNGESFLGRWSGRISILAHPEGVTEISRGLSPRKPPVNSSESSHPEGMPEDQPKTEMRPVGAWDLFGAWNLDLGS